MSSANAQVGISQINMNMMMESLVTFMMVIMMMKFMMGAMGPATESKSRSIASIKYGPLEPPPGYRPLRTAREAKAAGGAGEGRIAARARDDEELEAKRLSHISIGESIAKEFNEKVPGREVKFVRLDRGWQETYVKVRYWFEDSEGNNIVASDIDELVSNMGSIRKYR